MKNLILIGMPGCGKSTVGVLCAKALGMPFLDTDLVLQSRSGRLLQSLVDELGTEGFLRLEEEVILGIACEGTVLATGGSVALEDRAIAAPAQDGRFGLPAPALCGDRAPAAQHRHPRHRHGPGREPAHALRRAHSPLRAQCGHRAGLRRAEPGGDGFRGRRGLPRARAGQIKKRSPRKAKRLARAPFAWKDGIRSRPSCPRSSSAGSS